jgi:uncharacterized protein YaaR (DUF327 family)
MERLNRPDRSTRFTSRSSGGKRRADQVSAVGFGAALRRAEESPEAEHAEPLRSAADTSDLSALLDEIYEIGERLKRDPLPASVLRYKSAVRGFMDLVVRTSLDVVENQSSPNILRQKKYTLIRVIDQKLERLASGVLSTQREALDVLGRIEEINGLLVDLVS